MRSTYHFAEGTDVVVTNEAIDQAIVECIRPGQDIVIGQAFSFPHRIVERLKFHGELLQGSRIFCGMLPNTFPKIEGVRIETMFPSGPLGTIDGMQDWNARYCRQSLYSIATDFIQGNRPVDVAIGAAALAGDGAISFALGADFILPAAKRAQSVIVEIVPGVCDAGPLSRLESSSRIHAIELDSPVPMIGWSSEGNSALACNLLDWIEDGSALELGMGTWAGPLLERLATSRKGLRLFTGSFGEWIFPLIERGAIDPSIPLVATVMGGKEGFYERAQSYQLQIGPADFTHNPERLRAIGGFRAINSALEVDLTGRANCERLPGGRLGGIGGLPDFAGAAAASPSGLSIIALPSTSKGQSRIVPRLTSGAASLDREMIDVVVTEHGSADLRGLDPRDAAKAIAKISDPEHRTSLLAESNMIDDQE